MTERASTKGRRRCARAVGACAAAAALLATTLILPAVGSAASRSTAASNERRGTRTSLEGLGAATGFAITLVKSAPVPQGATFTPSLEYPLVSADGTPAMTGLVDVQRNYRLSGPLDLRAFLLAHHAAGSAVGGASTMSGSNVIASTTIEVTFPFANRNISYEKLAYTTGRAPNGVSELRVDALVEWAPVHTILMPTTGLVKVTLFQKLSLMAPSSDPLTVVLTRAQAVAMQGAIATLSNTNGGTCAEDATMFTIAASSKRGGPSTWNAVASECPNLLTLTSGLDHALLSDTSCALDAQIVNLFARERSAPAVKFLSGCRVGWE